MSSNTDKPGMNEGPDGRIEIDRRQFLKVAAALGATLATASCGPRSLVGEGTIFSGDPATATVTLARDGKVWSIDAEALRAFAEAHPDVRQILDHGFTRSLAEKLDAANRAADAAR